MGYGPTSLVWGYQCTAIALLRISSHYKLCFYASYSGLFIWKFSSLDIFIQL